MYPTPYVPTYSYTGFSQSLGDGSFPGVQIDADLAAIKRATDTLDANWQQAFRSDGRLTNGSVGRDALSSDIQIGLAPPAPWTMGCFYRRGATVTYQSALFYCIADHVADDFTADLGAQFWALIMTFAQIGFLGENSVGTDNIVDGAVTTAKLAPNSVTGAQIAPGSITAAAVAPNFGVMPIGTSIDFDGIQLPSGFLWKDGSAYARIGDYAPLFKALTLSTTADVTTGNATIANVPIDITKIGPNALVGAAIEGLGVPINASVVSYTSNSITLSSAAVGTNAGVTITIFPHGNGDGSTTFNVPDDRSQVNAGRDDMGGTARGVLTTAFSARGGALGAEGGATTHALTDAENGPHSHGTTEHPHNHGTTENPHDHGDSQGGAIFNGALNPGSVQFTTEGSGVTGEALTGLTINDATTGLTVNSDGSGTPHNNIQPTRVTNKIIFAGV